MDKETILNNIFASDPLGLLDIKAKNPVVTADDRLVATFEKINDFYEINNQEPQKTTDMNERKLFSRLKGMRGDPIKATSLKKHDRHNLLGDDKW